MDFTSLRTIDQTIRGKLLDKEAKDKQPCTLKTFYEDEINKTFFGQVKELLTKEECKQIIKKASKYEFKPLDHAYSKEVRDSKRLCILDNDLEELLWKRLEPLVTNISFKMRPFGFDVNGEWSPFMINNCFRLSSYEKNSKGFKEHFDSQLSLSSELKSIFTLVIYLNSDFEGGETVLYERKPPSSKDLISPQGIEGKTFQEEIQMNGGIKKYKKFLIKPELGKGILFNHDTLHSGEPVQSGTKYIIRTDIVYKRKSKIPSIFKQNLFSKCTEYFREAQQSELENKVGKASDLYEKALFIRRVVSNIESFDNIQEFLNVGDCWNIILSFLSLKDQMLIGRTSKLFRSYYLESKKGIWQDIRKSFTKGTGLPKPDKYIPSLIKGKGTKLVFEFKDSKFFKRHKDRCLKVAAMYSIVLFGNRGNSYVADYDPETKTVLKCSIEDLLKSVFYELPCTGTFYHLCNNPEARLDQDFTLKLKPDAFDEKSSSDEEKEESDEDEENSQEDEDRSIDEYSNEEDHEDKEEEAEIEDERNYTKKRKIKIKSKASKKKKKDLPEETKEQDIQELFKSSLDQKYLEKKYNETSKDYINIQPYILNRNKYKNSLDHFKDGYLPSFSSINIKVGVQNIRYCDCGLGSDSKFKGLNMYSNYNNMVFDFSKSSISIEEAQNEKEFTIFKQGKECYVADINKIGLKGFNHASCHCERESIRHEKIPIVQTIFKNQNFLNKIGMIVENGNRVTTEYYGVVF